MASFLIEVATCKLKAPEAKEPPPQTLTDDPDPKEDKDYVEELHLGGDPKTTTRQVGKTPAKPAAKSPAPNTAPKVIPQ